MKIVPPFEGEHSLLHVSTRRYSPHGPQPETAPKPPARGPPQNRTSVAALPKVVSQRNPACASASGLPHASATVIGQSTMTPPSICVGKKGSTSASASTSAR